MNPLKLKNILTTLIRKMIAQLTILGNPLSIVIFSINVVGAFFNFKGLSHDM
jgi:hypothetical protein